MAVNPLVAMRRKAGFTSARKASEALGISRIHLAQVEAGKGSPSWGLLARMIAAYGVTEKQLRFELRKARRSYLDKQRKRIHTQVSGSER